MAKYVMIIFKIAKGLNTKRSHFSFINIKIKEIFLPQHSKPLNIRCGSHVSICLAEIPQRERYNLILYILMLRLDLEMTKIRVFIKDTEWATSEKQNHFSQLTTNLEDYLRNVTVSHWESLHTPPGTSDRLGMSDGSQSTCTANIETPFKGCPVVSWSGLVFDKICVEICQWRIGIEYQHIV